MAKCNAKEKVCPQLKYVLSLTTFKILPSFSPSPHHISPSLYHSSCLVSLCLLCTTRKARWVRVPIRVRACRSSQVCSTTRIHEHHLPLINS